MDTIYFDHAATTPLDKRVLEAMKPYFCAEFGNANSAHQLGNNAKVAVEEARETVAEHIGAAPAEIIFTSGGTESDNAAIKGVLGATGKKEVITSPLEHHAVLHTVEAAKRDGVQPIYVESDDRGVITARAVAEALTEETALVSIMHVNNELGTINPIEEIADVCHEHGVPFHSDTVQSVGKLPIDVEEFGIDLLSISGHKIYGPKGVGVLYMRHGSPWLPWMHGGSQERRRRGGTLNVPGIVGLAKAMDLVEESRENDSRHYKQLREKLVNGLHSQFEGIISTNADCDDCVPHIINLAIESNGSEGIDGEMLLLNLDMEGICVSNGSACTSGAVEPSHVLSGIGLDEHLANGSIRLSFGKSNTEQQIDYFLEKLEEVLPRMQPTLS
jgi:cysteine desulfurase